MEFLSYGFMRNALIAICIITPLFGMLGTMIVNNRMAFFSDALGHSAFTGIVIGAIFGIFDPNEILKCELVEHYQKPDFFIEYKGSRKYISLKSGKADEIAQEGIKSFVLYLRKCGISKTVTG